MLTENQRAVLAHVVVDPDAWYAHAIAHFGQVIADVQLATKVARWQAIYEAESVKPGYKTRVEREAEAKK